MAYAGKKMTKEELKLVFLAILSHFLFVYSLKGIFISTRCIVLYY